MINPLLLAWFISEFEPLQTLITMLYKYMPIKLKFTRTYLECFKCLSFWITLIMTQSFYLAVGFSIIAYVYTRLMNQLKINI